jgi:hypothetical protein
MGTEAEQGTAHCSSGPLVLCAQFQGVGVKNSSPAAVSSPTSIYGGGTSTLYAGIASWPVCMCVCVLHVTTIASICCAIWQQHHTISGVILTTLTALMAAMDKAVQRHGPRS